MTARTADKKVCEDLLDDPAIINRVQKGEHHYFDCIITRYEKRIFSYVMRFINDPEEAHDVVQTVFMKALRHIDSFDPERKLSSWIYRIAHNETMNWFARNDRRRTVSIEELHQTKDMLDTADATRTALDEWFHIELQDVLHEAVAQLPKQYADVIRMKYFEDRSYKEISEILGKPVSSVGTLIRRAKKRLLVLVARSQRLS